MRIRSTKPEFWKSRRIASVSWDARLVLKGLESYVDDNGVGVDDIELIVTDVFPRDMFANGRETVARVSEAITELHQAGLVHRYASESRAPDGPQLSERPRRRPHQCRAGGGRLQLLTPAAVAGSNFVCPCPVAGWIRSIASTVVSHATKQFFTDD